MVVIPGLWHLGQSKLVGPVAVQFSALTICVHCAGFYYPQVQLAALLPHTGSVVLLLLASAAMHAFYHSSALLIGCAQWFQ